MDYHWVGAITNTTATLNVAIRPKDYERMIAKNPVLEVILTGDGSFPQMKDGRILENKLAFSINFKDLNPGTRYFFVYKLKTKEGV